MVTKEIKEILSNSKGNIFIYLMVVIIVFISVSALVMDFANLYNQSKKIKHAVNRSVKASTLQIQVGEKLANGDFIIDPVMAREAFESILAKNLGLDENTLEPLEKSVVDAKPNIIEFHVENNTPTTYTSSTLGVNYPLEHPSVIAVLEVRLRGVFIRRNIRVGKLSSSQLTSIY